MIPILYSANETTFTHNGIGRLIDCTSCRVTEERNGAFECEFDYPIEGQYYSEISLDRIVKAKANEMSDDQLFRIYRISKPISGIVSVYCQHISYDLSVNVVLPFSLINDSAQNAMNAIFNNLSKPNQHTYTYTATVGGTHDFKVETPVPVRQALGGDEGSLLDVFGGEFEFDNFNIRLHQNRGQDRGVTILYGKNLTDAKSETNMTTAYTAILPYAVNEEDDTPVHLLGGSNKTIAIDGAPTYGEPRVLAVDLTSMYDLQEEDITSANLRQRANTYLSENDLKTISQNIEISFVQLWQTEEYKNIAVLERVALCDTVTVRYEKLGIDATAKVVKTVYDTINEKYESIEIGDAKSNFLESLRKEAKEQGKKAIKENYSAMQAAIDNATKLITGQSGGYIIFRNSTTIFDSNGNVVETKTLPKGQPAEMLIMDKPDVNTASKVWRYNLSGWGYSSTGVNGPFRLAATSNGAIVADFITTGTLTANIITAGQLQDQAGKNYWNLNNGNFRLSQSNAFNSLTHDGDTQGIYMVPVQGQDYNELRINASYIKSGTIDAGVVNVTNINASNINAGIIRDQTNATAKNYWNLSTGEFRLTAGTKVYKDDGTDSGIFYKASGELRINADYIKTGTLSANLIKAGTLESLNQVTSLNMSDGVLKINQTQSNGTLNLDGAGITYKDSSNNTSSYFRSNGAWAKGGYNQEAGFTHEGIYCQTSGNHRTDYSSELVSFSDNDNTSITIKPNYWKNTLEIAGGVDLSGANFSYNKKSFVPTRINSEGKDYIVLACTKEAYGWEGEDVDPSMTYYELQDGTRCGFVELEVYDPDDNTITVKIIAYKAGVPINPNAQSITGRYSYKKTAFKLFPYETANNETYYILSTTSTSRSAINVIEFKRGLNSYYERTVMFYIVPFIPSRITAFGYNVN